MYRSAGGGRKHLFSVAFLGRFLSEPEAHCWLGRSTSEFWHLPSPPGNARVTGMHSYPWLSSGCWRFKLRSLCATQPSLRLVGTQWFCDLDKLKPLFLKSDGATCSAKTTASTNTEGLACWWIRLLPSSKGKMHCFIKANGGDQLMISAQKGFLWLQ